MGVFWGEPERIELEFDAAVAPFVRGRAWHESQTVNEQPDGRLRVTLDVSNDWALRSWILGFGAGVRVLRPDALARSLREELRRAAARYETA
jgi:predicted DNA-binding transcriptional regulator YafY